MEAMTNGFMLLWCLAFLGQVLACKTDMNDEMTPAKSLPNIINKADLKQSRVERGTQRFFDPGNGQKCALSTSHSDHDNLYYDHVDENGNQCECPLCRQGEVLKGNCSCADPLAARETRCEKVDEQNHMMPYISKCETAVPCKTCILPWTFKSPCNHRGPDTECECPAPDYYLVTPDDCQPVPRCDKGHEPATGHGEDYTEMRCQPCREGYYQPDNNSTNKCRKSRQCTVKESTIYEDATCLNDPDPDELSTLSTATTTASYNPHDQAESSTVAPCSCSCNHDMADIDDGTPADNPDTASDANAMTTDVNEIENDGPTVPNEEGRQWPPPYEFFVNVLPLPVVIVLLLIAVALYFKCHRIKDFCLSVWQSGQYRVCTQEDASKIPDPDTVDVDKDPNDLAGGVDGDNGLLRQRNAFELVPLSNNDHR